MKIRINKSIVLGIVSIPLITHGFYCHAETQLVKPTEPVIEGEITNEKITVYNQQVDEYNSKVDEYNSNVDKKYEEDLALVKQQNIEIDAHNAEEQSKVKQIEASNAQKQAEYDAAYAQYQKDKEIEAKILAKGFESVQAYNDYINNYNSIIDLATEKNAAATSFDISKTYSIEQGQSDESQTESTDEPDLPQTIEVTVVHNFDEIGVSYSDEFEIRKNDIITFYSVATQLEQTQPGYATFYLGIGDKSEGYWMQGSSELQTNAVYCDSSGWNCGDTHVVSYKDGVNHYGDDTHIYMTYNYSWVTLSRYPTYNIPQEPVLELDSYTPNFLNHIDNPIRKEYLSYLNHMDPLPENEPTPEPEPGNDSIPPIPDPGDDPMSEPDNGEFFTEEEEEDDNEINSDSDEINKNEEIDEEETSEEKKEEIANPAPTFTPAPAQARSPETGDATKKLALRVSLLGFCLVLLFGLFIDSFKQ